MQPKIGLQLEQDSSQSTLLENESFSSFSEFGIFQADYIYMNQDIQTVYNDLLSSSVQQMLEGISGKLYQANLLILGSSHTTKYNNLFGNSSSEKGLCYLTLSMLFDLIHQQDGNQSILQAQHGKYDSFQNQEGAQFLVKLSAFEIFNETINDLQSISKNLPLEDDQYVMFTQEGVTIHGITEKYCKTYTEACRYLDQIRDKRSMDQMDQRKINSHYVVRIKLESLYNTQTTKFVYDDRKIGSFHQQSTTFEQSSSLSGQTCTRSLLQLIETGAYESLESTDRSSHFLTKVIYTQGLTNLGIIIKKLSSGLIEVAYRATKLTRVLSKAFGQSSGLAILCHISPTHDSPETISNITSLCSNIKSIQIDPRPLQISTHQSEILRLKSEIDRLEERLFHLSPTRVSDTILTDNLDTIHTEISETAPSKELFADERSKLELELSSIKSLILSPVSLNASQYFSFESSPPGIIIPDPIPETESEEEQMTGPMPRISNLYVEIPIHTSKSQILPRLSIPEEPSANLMNSFYCKKNELSRKCKISVEAGIPEPHPEWMRIIIEQDTVINNLNKDLAVSQHVIKEMQEQMHNYEKQVELLKNQVTQSNLAIKQLSDYVQDITKQAQG